MLGNFIKAQGILKRCSIGKHSCAFIQLVILDYVILVAHFPLKFKSY